MAGYIIGYFGVAIIVIVLAVFYRAARKEALYVALCTDRMNFVVRVPRIFRVLGIVFAALFGACLIFSSFTVPDDPGYPFFTSVFAGFLITGSLLVYYSYRWKLIVADDRLVLTPVFGRERTYSIRDVTHIEADAARGVCAYSNQKRLFSVNSVSVGCGMLVSYFIEKGVRAPERINLPH